MPITGLILTALLAQAAPPAAPPAATQPTFEQERAEHLKSVETEFAELARGPSVPVSKLLSVTLDDGNIRVRPLLAPTGGAVRVDVTDWPGYVQCTVGEAQSLAMFLKHIDTRDPKVIASYTHVSTSVDYLQISRDTESAAGMTTIELIQARQHADENDFPIRLTVRQTFDEVDKAPVERKFAAENFATLRQRHARELRTYLLPVLRDLGAAELINSSTPALAWQVLGDAIPVDPKLDATLKALTVRLGAADFNARVTAEDELANLGPDAAAALRRQDLSALPPDPATTLRLFRQRHEPVPPARAAELTKDVHFLLDSLLHDDARLRTAAAAQLSAVMGTAVDFPAALSPADRAQRVEALRDRFIPATQPAQ
ncbi:MAG TPA: hypothetical protein VF624_02235 [Tepidisphaeraceae bacterium]|jgi:hypothetical protein